MSALLRRRSRSGSVLLATLFVVVLVTVLVGISMNSTSSIRRISHRSEQYAAANKAAEGAVEYAFGIWKQRITQKDAPLTATEANQNLVPPTFPNVTYATSANNGPLEITATDQFGNSTATPTGVNTLLEDYPGWRGKSYSYLASARFQSSVNLGGAPAIAGARRRFEYVVVPLFQSMFFFENNLEIYRPAPMIVGGLVHTNNRLLVSGMADRTGIELQFNGAVSYAGGNATTPGYTTSEPPIGGPAWAGFSSSDAVTNMEAPTFASGGQSAQLSQVNRYEPLGAKPNAVLNATDTNSNNDTMRELIEPPVATSSDPPEIARRRLFNKAGIILQVNGSTATVTAQNGTVLSAAKNTEIRNAFTGKTTFYDQREGSNVDTVNVDVGRLTTALNSGVTGFNGVLYIHDVTPVSGSDPEPKTVRLNNGGELPNAGLSIASQNPVYIRGDYNTGTTTSPTAVPANSTGNPSNTDSPVVPGYTRKPAAVMADAVMLLSNNWNDANASASLSSRVASNTTYNVALLAGFMPSGWTPPSGSAYGYSGGANNYPRFLETWNSKSCTYYGSMIELFQSKVFTGEWDTGNIYRPPLRRWNFDTMFSDTPPPGGLEAVAIGRGAWMKF